MDATSQKINDYILAASKALPILIDKFDREITGQQLQNAIADISKIDRENSIAVAELELSADEIIALIEANDFEFPKVLASLKLSYEEFSGDDDPLFEVRLRNNGKIWEIHKYDKDPFPSDPHGHNLASGDKLHLGNGDLYNYKNDPLGKKISKKELMAVRNMAQLKGIVLPTLTV